MDRLSRFVLLALTAVAALPLAALLPPGPQSSDEVSPAARRKIAPWVWDRTQGGAEAEFLVVLADQADLSPARALETKAEKGRFVYEALYRKAQETQAPLLEELRARGVEHRAYYIVNLIWATGGRALALDLAERDDVARVVGNPRIRNIELPLEPEEPLEDSPSRADAPLVIEEGIAYVRAPQLWSLGFTGQGVVVGGGDTGYRWTHQALRPQYRGWDGSTASHDYNWHDSIHSGGGSCGANSPVPCDDNGHGTHTMGTAVGWDGGANQVGMAPGAKWIGCRNMDQGNGTPATYVECFEFFLAPYPVGGTPGEGNPALAPDVTVNSWSCPLSEGCFANTLLAAIQAQRAAGIVTEVSAGNGGAGCSSVADPPAIYDDSFSVGALSCAGNVCTDNLASFSSRGPVARRGFVGVKPDIAAPGTSVRSSFGTGDTVYSSLQGTSMSGPHVGGGVALLLSAFPALSGDVDGIENRLGSSAFRISTTVCDSTAGVYPNTLFGHGRLDLGCAVPAKVTGDASVCQGGSTQVQADLVGTLPWDLTWSDAFVQNGVTSTPATRMVSPESTTVYTLTNVVNGACNQSGAGSATVTVATDLSSVTVNVVGSTTIGSPAPCVGGTATVADTGGGVNAHQWGFRTTQGGAITDIAGQTGPSHVLACTDFPAPGVYWLVERTTPQCGAPLVSNETMVTVNAMSVELMRFERK